MGLNKKARRDKVLALAKVYKQQIKLSDQLIDMMVERSRDEVWRRSLSQKEYQYRKTTTIAANGTLLPEDFVAWAGQAYYVGAGSVNIDLSYVDIAEIAEVKTSNYVLATSANPVFYICDQKVYFLPDTTMIDPTTGLAYASNITNVIFEYYYQPVRLFGNAIADAVTDNMPQDTEDVIARGAFERCLQLMLDEATAFQINQAELAQVREATDKFYNDQVMLNSSPRETKV